MRVASFVILLILIAVHDTYAQSPPSCTHYASNTGSGGTCTISTPCLINTWTTSSSLAIGGNVLCLNDGVYTGVNSMINPTDTFSGSAGNPITIRAVNDGAVLINGQNVRDPVFFTPTNEYWEIWGINAANGFNDVFRLGNHSRAYRVIGWNGTSGQSDSNILELGRGVDNIFIDSAGFGTNSRKILNGSQSLGSGANSQTSGFRRVWAMWQDHPLGASRPSNTAQVGYQTKNQIFENIVVTWNTISGGNTDRPEGAIEAFIDCDGSMTNDASGTKVLGSIAYLPSGASFPSDKLAQAYCASNMTWTDVVSFLGGGFTGVRPFYFPNFGIGGATTGNSCNNCLAVHNGTVSVNQSPGSGWTLNDFREGSSLAAATGGTSVFELLPGICKRYEAGTLTDDPLWPWPMNQRIIDAMTTAGYTPVDVTATMVSLFGEIPTECTTAGTPQVVSKNRFSGAY